jgi:hypothetical protein
MTYDPHARPPHRWLIGRLIDRFEARRRAALRRADVERRRRLAARVWAIQIVAATVGDVRRP